MRSVSFILAVTLTCVNASADLASQIQPLINQHEGDVSVLIRNLETGEQFAWRERVVVPTASLIKLPVMVTAYRRAESGLLDLSRQIELKDEDKVPGSGILSNHFSAGTKISIRDAIRLMMRYSDNTATNLVIDQMGLPATSTQMEALGYPETQLHAKVYRSGTSIAPARSQKYGLGSTTATDIISLLTSIHRRTAATADSCEAMINHLLSCEDRGMLGRELPDGSWLAHKTGGVRNSRCDAGLLMTPKGMVAICVLTTKNKDQSWSDANAAHVLMGRLGKSTYDHFHMNAEHTASDTKPTLRVGAFGIQVEDLQRTLNRRLDPSPKLSVDGDFGPATASAVRRFQEEKGLPANGIVDAAFWNALGLIVQESEVLPPESINNQKLPVKSKDPLTGPPFVTCDAWTIVEISTGREMASSRATKQRDIASTTKMMTAWLVAELASRDPEILDETLTMSINADQTRGSTSGVRSGEQLTIRDAMYALMLPSGNDISVAIAEHFGNRVAHEQADTAKRHQKTKASLRDEHLKQFIDSMNDEAKRLGMSQTQYKNPHGLTESGHYSTANDLAVLGRKMLSNEFLCKVISTRQHGATLHGSTGYERNVVWTNTNQLLGIEGFDGIKTGTTTKAGACLVSTGTRDGRRILIVVLGSAASSARYTDTKNLYRWAWKQLASD